VIWTGTVALLFMAFMSWVVVALPPAPSWGNQAAYEAIFGQVPRIVFASIAAFWAGEFVNAFVLALMKVWTGGKHLWSRTIGSTVAGQGIDSLIFYPLAFWGAAGWTTELVLKVMVTQWVLKVSWEAILTPVTYAAVGFLKRREGVDVYDEGTDFTPFAAIAAGQVAARRASASVEGFAAHLCGDEPVSGQRNPAALAAEGLEAMAAGARRGDRGRGLGPA
jgi:queuosine precursor transporter